MICVLIVSVIIIFGVVYALQYNPELNVSELTWRQLRCNYVASEIMSSHSTESRLGNFLFFYSALMYVASITGRCPCILRRSIGSTPFDAVFDHDLVQVDNETLVCRQHKFTEQKFGVYDQRVASLVDTADDELLVLHGLFQSWKYVQPIAGQLRDQLRFRRELKEFASKFLHKSVPLGWNGSKFVRVGVHVRRGDFIRWPNSWIGYTAADEHYLRRAMNIFTQRFLRVQFVVTSDDIRWCQKHIKSNSSGVNITFSVGHSAGEDLALLASCDHTVMTTGTFSWWAAWLANGITIYYANFPKRFSWLSIGMQLQDYYYPNWTGLV